MEAHARQSMAIEAVRCTLTMEMDMIDIISPARPREKLPYKEPKLFLSSRSRVLRR